MTDRKRERVKHEQRLADLKLVADDPFTKPTVKALLSLPAFDRELKKHAKLIRERLEAEAKKELH